MSSQLKTITLSLWVLTVAACTSVTPQDPRFDQRELNDNVAQIRAVAHVSDLILVARVRSISPLRLPPSGVFENRQSVNYDVVQVLRGHYTLPEIDVAHLLVANSRQHDPGGGLSQQLFRPGAMLILMVRRDDIFFEDGDENFSALPHSANNQEAILHNM